MLVLYTVRPNTFTHTQNLPGIVTDIRDTTMQLALQCFTSNGSRE